MSRALAKLGPTPGARRSDTRALSAPPKRHARTSTSRFEASELTSKQGTPSLPAAHRVREDTLRSEEIAISWNRRKSA